MMEQPSTSGIGSPGVDVGMSLHHCTIQEWMTIMVDVEVEATMKEVTRCETVQVLWSLLWMV